MKDDYQDKLNFEIVSTQSERGQTEPAEYGLGRHGMVILGQDGNEILWKMKGHKITRDDIENGIQESLN